MSDTLPLHNTPAGATRIYWDSQTEGHHYYFIQATARAIRDTDEHLAVSRPAADRIDPETRTVLTSDHRLHIVDHWDPGDGGFAELRKIRSFMRGFEKPCKIVAITVCEFQWALALAALNPLARSEVSRITGNYFKARAIYERDLSSSYRIKYLLTRLGLTAWAGCLPAEYRIGSLVSRNVEHYNRVPVLKDRFIHVPDFQILDVTPCRARVADPDGTFTVCMVGEHAPRKGTLFALRSILRHYRLRNPLRIIIAGRLDKEPEIRELARTKSDAVEIELHDRFVDDDELTDVFSRSDLCLMPYVQFYSSSGVLILSATHRRPVLASDIGQVATNVREFGLGSLFPDQDEEGFVRALEAMILDYRPLAEESRNRYLNACSPEAYMEAMRKL